MKINKKEKKEQFFFLMIVLMSVMGIFFISGCSSCVACKGELAFISNDEGTVISIPFLGNCKGCGGCFAKSFGFIHLKSPAFKVTSCRRKSSCETCYIGAVSANAEKEGPTYPFYYPGRVTKICGVFVGEYNDDEHFYGCADGCISCYDNYSGNDAWVDLMDVYEDDSKLKARMEAYYGE